MQPKQFLCLTTAETRGADLNQENACTCKPPVASAGVCSMDMILSLSHSLLLLPLLVGFLCLVLVLLCSTLKTRFYFATI